MAPLDAFWHLFEFFLAALWVAVLAAAGAKLLWRRELAALRWRRLVAAPALAGALVLAAGLIVSGSDGRMLTYAALVVAAALALWWVAFGPGRR